ncbi:MAG TPA: hypothetical protein VF590_24210, partial [Isosphaeraceae bacterium]
GPDAKHRARMVADPDAPATARTFRLTLPSLASTVKYWVSSGSIRGNPYVVRAVAPPAVAALAARIEPPPYTKRPAAAAQDPARIEAWEGSRITLNVTPNKPVRSVAVTWPAPAPEAGGATASPETPPTQTVSLAPSPDGTTWTASVAAEASGTFALALRDEHGIANRPETPRRLVVRLDAPPIVGLAGSDEARLMGPDEVLRVGVAARDDLAVAAAELHYAVERVGTAAEPRRVEVPAPLPGLGTRSAKGQVALDLKPLRLGAGDTVTYRVKVADSRPAPRGPNVTWSQARTLAIVDQAEALARRDAAERSSIQAQLDAIKQANAANRRETEQLRYAADAVQKGNGRWDPARDAALNGREAAARDVADRLQLLARDLDDHPRFAPLAQPTRQVAEIEAEAGRAMLAEARRAPDAARRLADLQQADARLGAVGERLDELQRRLDALARGDDGRRNLRALAEREDRLAALAAALRDNRAERARLDQIHAEQDRLRRDLEELLRQSPELRAEVLAAHAREAADLADRARDLARRQREQARQTAELPRQSPALKALAAAQRQLEADARRLALDVQAPLEENGRGRLNTEAIGRAAEPIARGDLDAARPRLDEAETELRRLTRDLEDVQDDPKALARRLARRQDALRADVAAAVRDVKKEDVKTPEAKAALAERLKPLAQRQEAIAQLVATLPAPKDQKDPARDATERTAKAVASLRDPEQPGELDARQNEARNALNRLADALPDANRRREPVRQRLAEARRVSNDVARDLERILRETGPQPNRPFDPQKAATELAERLAPLAQRQAEMAANLDALDVEPRLEPQRQRAARRAGELATALARARREALPAVQADARAALDRLEQKFHGQMPADDLAEELAADATHLESGISNPKFQISDPAARALAAADGRRIATALRTLEVPDAPIPQAEAVRAAD